jgi:hypothetical protein
LRSMRCGSPLFRHKLAKIMINKFTAAIYLKYSLPHVISDAKNAGL